VPEDDALSKKTRNQSGPESNRWEEATSIDTLDEAGDDLFTFLRFPTLQWQALRTTNALERINGEFRCRTRTQVSLPAHG
jgi:putative transposase